MFPPPMQSSHAFFFISNTSAKKTMLITDFEYPDFLDKKTVYKKAGLKKSERVLESILEGNPYLGPQFG